MPFFSHSAPPVALCRFLFFEKVHFLFHFIFILNANRAEYEICTLQCSISIPSKCSPINLRRRHTWLFDLILLNNTSKMDGYCEYNVRSSFVKFTFFTVSTHTFTLLSILHLIYLWNKNWVYCNFISTFTHWTRFCVRTLFNLLLVGLVFKFFFVSIYFRFYFYMIWQSHCTAGQCEQCVPCKSC